MRKFLQLSLADLSPLNPSPEGHLLMVLKSYFDGGNQADSSEYDHISLATVCGTSNQWKRFDTEWKKVLFKNKVDFLHTTDAVALQNDFAREKGWDNTRVDKFISNCVGVIEKHMFIPSGISGKDERMGLYPITLTIPFDDWLRAKKEVPDIPDTIEEICATDCLSFAFGWGRKIGAKNHQLYFDRGEPFHGHIRSRWLHPKVKKDIELLKDVINVDEAIAKHVPALQMADLFAWSICHANQERRGWHVQLNSLPWESRALPYKYLINPSRTAIERTKKWGLSPRKSSEAALSRPKKAKRLKEE
jgi:hypothetical protein